MDWVALSLSFKLAGWTLLGLLPLGLWVGHTLARRRFPGKAWVEGALALPLVLPPTVLGYFLLLGLGSDTWLGGLYEGLFDRSLVFSFEGILVASLLFNLPFAIQPIQRAFESIDPCLSEAAACCGLSAWRTFWRIELPLAWPGLLTAAVMTFAHTLGEFGVVLMVGGSIPGETQTIAIAIYDRVQAFDNQAAGAMSGLLLGLSLIAISLTFLTVSRFNGRPHV